MTISFVFHSLLQSYNRKVKLKCPLLQYKAILAGLYKRVFGHFDHGVYTRVVFLRPQEVAVEQFLTPQGNKDHVVAGIGLVFFVEDGYAGVAGHLH